MKSIHKGWWHRTQRIEGGETFYKKYLIALSIIWLTLQFILVFYKEPVAFISDEILYKRIAYSLFQLKPALSWHYPILYPLVISIGLFFQEYFYEAMLIVNILLKWISLCIIWKLLIKEMDKRRGVYTLILIGFSPIYFLYSRVLFAENLACPLLIISVLYHEHYKKLIRGIGGVKSLIYTIGAATLSLALFWTKYLMLVVLPIFCLFWSMEQFRGPVETRKKIKLFFTQAFIYTCFILACIVLYAWIYVLRVNQPFSFDIILGTMGFTTGSGPSNNGYALSVEFKWLMSYALYALLGSILIIAGMVSNAGYNLLKKNRDIIILCFVLIMALIYVSARHSTYVDYNAGGKMMNLCGRYVAYTTPLLAICWMRTRDFSDCATKKIMRKICGVIIGISIVWGAYEMLYVLSPGVKQSTSWLTGLRAADNAGFMNLRAAFCVMVCVGICIVIVANIRIGICVVCILMSVNSFSAIFTCEKYHTRDYEYAIVTKRFCDRHKYDNAVVLCTDELDNIYINTLFYEYGDVFSKISIWPLTSAGQQLYFDNSSGNYLFTLDSASVDKNAYDVNRDLFEGDLKERKIFLKWNKNRFQNTQKELPILSINDEQIRISCEYNDTLAVVCGSYFLPVWYEEEEDQIIAVIDKGYIEEDIIYVYNLSDLTMSKLILK